MEEEEEEQQEVSKTPEETLKDNELMEDYLNDKFGTFSDKPSDISDYLNDKFNT